MSGSSFPKTISTAVDHLSHFQRRVVVEAMLDGWGATWERAAVRYERARPRPHEFHGKQSTDQLRAKWHELTEVAAACRARAAVSPLDLVAPDVDDVLGEVA